LSKGLLEQAAGVLASPRTLMIWEEPEGTRTNLAFWSRTEFQLTQESADILDDSVSETLAGKDFLCPDVSRPSPVVLYDSSGVIQPWRGRPVSPTFQSRFSVRSVLSLRLSGESLRGRLFILDKRGLTPDDLVLSKIVAHQVTALMVQHYLVQWLQRTAAEEERVRMARDLHDGLLQRLAGIGLRIETADRILETTPGAAHEVLQEIQQHLVAEQTDLRFLIRQLKPGKAEENEDLTSRLRKLSRRVKRLWGLHVELTINNLQPNLPPTLVLGACFIVHEALSNAARHAAASTVRVDLGLSDFRLRIAISDNGHGFLFKGRHDHEALSALNLGPVSIRERVENLGGTLSIHSTECGASLAISLPVIRQGVYPCLSA
jgi:signal transduction histidine kinase